MCGIDLLSMPTDKYYTKGVTPKTTSRLLKKHTTHINKFILHNGMKLGNLEGFCMRFMEHILPKEVFWPFLSE